MVHAGCVFVAGIHPPVSWMSGSFESVRWNACVHRLDLVLYSHPKEFWGNGVRTHANSKGKIPSTRKILLRGGPIPQHCIKQDSEPNTLPMSYFTPPPPPTENQCFNHWWTDMGDRGLKPGSPALIAKDLPLNHQGDPDLGIQYYSDN